MAEETLEKVLVRYERLQCITYKVKFQVLKEGRISPLNGIEPYLRQLPLMFIMLQFLVQRL